MPGGSLRSVPAGPSRLSSQCRRSLQLLNPLVLVFRAAKFRCARNCIIQRHLAADLRMAGEKFEIWLKRCYCQQSGSKLICWAAGKAPMGFPQPQLLKCLPPSPHFPGRFSASQNVQTNQALLPLRKNHSRLPPVATSRAKIEGSGTGLRIRCEGLKVPK